MHKGNLKIFTRASHFLVPPSRGSQQRVVCFFPTTLGANPVQASKHHNTLTIFTDKNTSSKSEHIYNCFSPCLMASIRNVRVGKCLPNGGFSFLFGTTVGKAPSI